MDEGAQRDGRKTNEELEVTKENEKSCDSMDEGTQEQKDDQGKPGEHSLTKESASVILAVTYNAISSKFITRQQLVSGSKTLKLKMKTSLAKEEYLVPVATALIKQGFIKLSSAEVTRENVLKLKSF
ncbi:hypothetical protein OS493_006910 [Desmophyllum pertusum]|uniref:Uncharacterized protein n=1 Tax=Desmophyllum pertusum TaxID=174260 RepID=A0A9X0D554_9CNID|nr:hypothetical protein OS493_006910 [Desmophyllum pertusum]